MCALNNFSHNFDYLLIETISNHLPTSMKISKVTFYSLIGLVGQAAQGREQDFEWTNEEVICAEFNSVALVAQNPIFVDVDGIIQDFGQGWSSKYRRPSDRQQVQVGWKVHRI